MKLSPRNAIYFEWFMAVAIAVGVVSVWRGGWLILDVFVLPGQPLWSAVVSTVLGIVLLVLLCAVQPSLASWARAHQSSSVALWASDLTFTYAGSWEAIFMWRGVWKLWDELTGFGVPPAEENLALAQNAVLSHCAGIALLLVLGALRNLVAAPMVIQSDASLPIFGAGSTAGIAFLNPLERLRRPPPVPSAEEWHKLVGVPYVGDDAPPPLGALEVSSSGIRQRGGGGGRGDADGTAEGSASASARSEISGGG